MQRWRGKREMVQARAFEGDLERRGVICGKIHKTFLDFKTIRGNSGRVGGRGGGDSFGGGGALVGRIRVGTR